MENKTAVIQNFFSRSADGSYRIKETEMISELEAFKNLMMRYQCASMEVETKLKVLRSEFSAMHDRNPFEGINCRIKEPASIFEKMKRKGHEFTVENIEKYLDDVAGIRVICSFPEDVYLVRDLLLKQDDIKLIEEVDYITTPKPNGYRSLHLVIEVPIFLAEEKCPMRVEVQLRTIAMDFWASLEHKLKYKKDIAEPELIAAELKECAEASAQLDVRMQQIRSHIDAT